MGTEFRITIAGGNARAATASAKAFARAKELDDRLSDYKSDSELMHLCDSAGHGPIHVSNDLFTVMCEAQRIAEATDGAFDVTIGPLVRLWRLARRTRELPHADEITSARAKVGYKHIKLNSAQQTIELTKAGMKLDLGGIAKGYAADEMVKVLREAGCPSCLVSAGGDVVAGDGPPGEPGWVVAIAPLTPTDQPPVLMLANAAVSTSGSAEQFVDIAGKRYSHIVDPKTGIGLIGQFAVTVKAINGAMADALATAAAVMGPKYGATFVEGTEGAMARFAWIEDGEFRVKSAGVLKK